MTTYDEDTVRDTLGRPHSQDAWGDRRDNGDQARYVLPTGNLSLAGLAELAKRVRAGEDEKAVRAELLVREGKGVPA